MHRTVRYSAAAAPPVFILSGLYHNHARRGNIFFIFVKAGAVFCRAELIFKKALQIIAVCDIISRYLRCGADMLHKYGIAGMMELADVPDSKSGGSDTVRVRPPLPAPNRYNPNRIFLIGDGFGLFVFFGKFEDTHFGNGAVKRPESKFKGPREPKPVKDK